MARAAVAAESPATSIPEPPRAVAKPPPDPSQPIALSALLLARPYGQNQTDTIIRVGHSVANGIGVGGLCESITLYPNGTIVVAVRKGVARGLPEAERAKFATQYLTFREGFGEVAT